MMLASRTGFADTLALDYARELQIGGQVFLWVGDFDGRRYYASQLDTMSLHTWKNDEQIRWDQIQPNLLVVNSQAENDGLQSLLEAASIDKVWLGLTDDDNVGIGEGNWTFLRDSSQVAFGNAPWLLNGSTDADPNFLRGTDIPDHLMDYAQLWTGAVGDTTNFWIQSHSGEGPLQATPASGSTHPRGVHLPLRRGQQPD